MLKIEKTVPKIEFIDLPLIWWYTAKSWPLLVLGKASSKKSGTLLTNSYGLSTG